MKKKTIIIIATVLIFVTVISVFILNQPTLQLFINNKEIDDTYEVTMEYDKDLSIDTNSLHLKAMYNEKNITNKLKYKKLHIDKLKTYELDFEYDNEVVLKAKVKIVDTTAPAISGETNYKVYQNEPFDIKSLNLDISDNYDTDLKSKIVMPSIDTKNVGKQNITLSLTDSSNNKSLYKIVVDVQPKPVVALPGKPIDNNIVSNPYDITVLVNKSNYLPDGWSPNDLVKTSSGYLLRKQAADAWEQLYAKAISDNINIRIVSAYRSQAYQKSLYANYYASDPAGAPFYSAKARTSEHELGLAIDVSYDYQLHNDLHLTSIGIWMNAYAHNYGYIMRYPSDKTNITNYMHEPWHYRYVGKDLATYLKSNNLTLEEYYRKA